MIPYKLSFQPFLLLLAITKWCMHNTNKSDVCYMDLDIYGEKNKIKTLNVVIKIES